MPRASPKQHSQGQDIAAGLQPAWYDDGLPAYTSPHRTRMSRLSSLLLVCLLSAQAGAADRVDYLREVKPIFVQKCFACHGVLKQQSGLRLDTAAMMKSGGDSGPAIVPGKSGESLLFQKVSAAD